MKRRLELFSGANGDNRIAFHGKGAVRPLFVLPVQGKDQSSRNEDVGMLHGWYLLDVKGSGIHITTASICPQLISGYGRVCLA
jgi:hypothetical protein